MTGELRFVSCQVALVTGALAVGRPWPVAAGLGTAAAVLLAASLTRVRGEWFSTTLATRLRHLLRRTTHDVGSPQHEPEALLGLLAPGASLRTADLGGTAAGLLSRQEELVVVLRPLTDSVADLLSFEAEGVVGQLVVHAGPVRDRRPRAWLAVRAHRDITVFDDETLSAMLANILRRHLKGTHPLSEKDIHAAVVALTHTGSGRGLLHESWAFWRAGSVIQAGFRLAGFDQLRHDRWPLLEELLSAAPGVALTATVTTGAHSVAVLRIAGTNQSAVNAAAAELAHIGGHRGVRLERLDGRHARAVAATLPIGGGSL